MGTGWHGSDRRAELPTNWSTQLVPAVWERDGGRCRWPTDAGTCDAPGRDVDHINDPHDHRLSNLRLLCGWHHDRKSSAEGNRARVRYSRRRPAEQHPGLL